MTFTLDLSSQGHRAIHSHYTSFIHYIQFCITYIQPCIMTITVCGFIQVQSNFAHICNNLSHLLSFILDDIDLFSQDHRAIYSHSTLFITFHFSSVTSNPVDPNFTNICNPLSPLLTFTLDELDLFPMVTGSFIGFFHIMGKCMKLVLFQII